MSKTVSSHPSVRAVSFLYSAIRELQDSCKDESRGDRSRLEIEGAVKWLEIDYSYIPPLMPSVGTSCVFGLHGC